MTLPQAQNFQPFCEIWMLLAFALQAPRKLYTAYVHVNAVVEVAAKPPVSIPLSRQLCRLQVQSVAGGTPATTAIPVRFLNQRLREHRSVEFVPVVEIIQVHRVFRGRIVIGHTACAQNAVAGFVIVVVTAHGGVVLFDGVAI